MGGYRHDEPTVVLGGIDGWKSALVVVANIAIVFWTV